MRSQLQVFEWAAAASFQNRITVAKNLSRIATKSFQIGSQLQVLKLEQLQVFKGDRNYKMSNEVATASLQIGSGLQIFKWGCNCEFLSKLQLQVFKWGPSCMFSNESQLQVFKGGHNCKFSNEVASICL